MRKRTIGIFATSVALCALCLATDVSAASRPGGHPGGGRGGGGGFHFGGGHGFGGFHAGGMHFGGHSFAHTLGGRSFAHAFGHRSLGRFAGHNAVHNATRLGTSHALNAANHALNATHDLNASHNAPTTHDTLNNDHANRTLTSNEIAHNRFADRNFRGLYNFNHDGFNRNAFGDGHRWNHWGGHFWGAGWNNWGGGWGGWAGPVFWPFLYGDIFSFAFWPYDYYDPFWAYGAAFLLGSIFAPGPYFGPEYGYGPDYYGNGGSPNVYYGLAGGRQVSPADRKALAETNTEAVQSCNGLAPGVSGLPIDQIRNTVHPAGDQAAALDDLSAGSSRANDIISASCSSQIPLTPVGRLDAAEKRLGAMIEAVNIMHPPLAKFYDSLSDEQRQRFDAMGSSSKTEGIRGSTGGDLAALCGQQSADATKLPVQRIEQVIEPNAQQQDAFNALKQASQDAANQLQSSCPSQVPQTPVARLDAVKTRLQAMVDAMNTVRPKLADFYASLSDEQKARFNTMGPPQSTAEKQSSN